MVCKINIKRKYQIKLIKERIMSFYKIDKAREISQWVIDNRFPKSEQDKISDMNMYVELNAKLLEFDKARDFGEFLLKFYTAGNVKWKQNGTDNYFFTFEVYEEFNKVNS